MENTFLLIAAARDHTGNLFCVSTDKNVLVFPQIQVLPETSLEETMGKLITANIHLAPSWVYCEWAGMAKHDTFIETYFMTQIPLDAKLNGHFVSHEIWSLSDKLPLIQKAMRRLQ